MSHEVETMAYAGELPWHGLGEKVSNDLTTDQMLVKAGLDWSVHEVESYVDFQGDKIKTGQILISPDDTEQRRRALNVRRTFDNLFKLKAIYRLIHFSSLSIFQKHHTYFHQLLNWLKRKYNTVTQRFFP